MVFPTETSYKLGKARQAGIGFFIITVRIGKCLKEKDLNLHVLDAKRAAYKLYRDLLMRGCKYGKSILAVR